MPHRKNVTNNGTPDNEPRRQTPPRDDYTERELARIAAGRAVLDMLIKKEEQQKQEEPQAA
jgi:hypothetical protein